MTQIAYFGKRLQLDVTAYRPTEDPLWLLAALPSTLQGHGAEWGAGNGALSLPLLYQYPDLTLDAYDNDPALCQALRGNLERNTPLFIAQGRVSPLKRLFIYEKDVLQKSKLPPSPSSSCEAAMAPSPQEIQTQPHQHAASLGRNAPAYDFIVSNPPFHQQHMPSTSATRSNAHHLNQMKVQAWLSGMADAAKPEALLGLITHIDWQPDILQIWKPLGALSFIALHSHPQKPATRLITLLEKGKRSPAQLFSVFTHQPELREAILRHGEKLHSHLIPAPMPTLKV